MTLIEGILDYSVYFLIGALGSYFLRLLYPRIKGWMRLHTKYFNSELVKKMKSGDIQSGDIISNKNSDSEYLVLDVCPDENMYRKTLIFDFDQNPAFFKERAVQEIVVDRDCRIRTESFGRLNMKSEKYKHRDMATTILEFTMGPDEREMSVSKERPEIVYD